VHLTLGSGKLPLFWFGGCALAGSCSLISVMRDGPGYSFASVAAESGHASIKFIISEAIESGRDGSV
jgi:hypothetical protein